MNILVIGLGFVGLTAALGFADKGFNVTGYDIDDRRAALIRSGRVPFVEPGLEPALGRTLGISLKISDSVRQETEAADLIFFCVGTPNKGDGSVDLRYLFSAIDSVIDVASPDCVFVIKSTVPPGTTADAVTPYVREKGFTGAVAVNPEFLREGHCWNDFMAPDRTVCGCGGKDARAISLLTKLYEPFNAPLHFVTPDTAEFIKYLSNSLLAALISFSNEMSLIAEAVCSADIAKAFKVLHQDKRLVGAGINHYIYPGCGYGGSCLPKDTIALSAESKQLGFEPRILDGVISLNNEMPLRTAEKIQRLAGSREAHIGVLGLSFKPNSDDVRDSPTAKIIECLIDNGYSKIYAYDPFAAEAFRNMYGHAITYCKSKEEVCEACDTIAVVTIWQEFQGIHLKYPQKNWCDCRYWLED